MCAWIITPPDQAFTEDAIRTLCCDQIAHDGVPCSVHFVQELPVTKTGRPQNVLMRNATMKDPGLAVQATA